MKHAQLQDICLYDILCVCVCFLECVSKGRKVISCQRVSHTNTKKTQKSFQWRRYFLIFAFNEYLKLCKFKPSSIVISLIFCLFCFILLKTLKWILSLCVDTIKSKNNPNRVFNKNICNGLTSAFKLSYLQVQYTVYSWFSNNTSNIWHHLNAPWITWKTSHDAFAGTSSLKYAYNTSQTMTPSPAPLFA